MTSFLLSGSFVFVVIVHRFRLKKPKDLPKKSVAANIVWNYCGDSQNQARRRGLRWPSNFDLNKLLTGSSKELGIHSHTIQAIARQFTISRDRAKRRPRWRKSSGSKRSRGWIPFQQASTFQIKGTTVIYMGKSYPMYMHRKIEGKILCGSFSENARGQWFVNIAVEVECAPAKTEGLELGIDLGLRDFATFSNGEKVDNPRHYRKEEERLARAQRANKKGKVKAISLKVANRRKHDLHNESIKLIRRCKSIYVGDVSSSDLAKTNLAKSVYDASWYTFKEYLRYKAVRHGVQFAEVSEAYSTQTCSVCHKRTGPKGRADLDVRRWECESCGVSHDRDINAAQNILLTGQGVGLRTGILTL